jgi:hypothetical protein
VRRKRRLATLALVAAVATFGAMSLGGGAAAADELHPPLTVTATTSITCDWTIDKTATFHGSPVTHLTLAVGEVATVDYTVTVTKTCTNHVHGTVNGSGSPTSVSVTAGGATGSCTPIVISGAHFSCTYDLHPASTAAGTVEAIATYADNSTATGSTPYSFAGVTPTEDSVDVFDSFAGTLAIHLGHSQSFHYTRDIVFHTCGLGQTVENTARVVDGTELDRVTYTIVVDVPCHGNGCTLTQGYWKTHSKYGPASKPDATWNLLPGGLGPDTVFFKSGQTWIQVFNTPPAGNVYYQLADQYMAAVLNILNGASSTAAVDAAISGAAGFFNTYTPAQAGALAKNSTARANALAWAGTLGSYNEGTIGPGHCDE